MVVNEEAGKPHDGKDSTAPERLISGAAQQDDDSADLSLRPRRLSDFVGYDMGQGGFAQTGRAVDDDVIQGFDTQLRRLDGYAQVVFDRVLAHEIR